MKKLIIIFITCIMLIITTKVVLAEDIVPNIIVLNGTDETKEGYPVYEEGGDKQAFVNLYDQTFIKKSVEIYAIAANKYSDLKEKDLYVAFKKNSGCYGGIGFYLKKDGELYDKTKSPFIELSTNQLQGNYDKLGSITQIFPHEMGHILYNITGCKDINLETEGNGTTNHYSNIITEYSTAFNEGFGEHFEVISRMYEENQQIKNGIYKDIDKTKNTIGYSLNSGNRDFILPLRLDYYRELSLFWQQKFENLKRNELPLNGDGKYKNLSYNFMNLEKSMLYRNMGLFQNKAQIRTYEQSLSTEIVTSSFFVKLITTDKGNIEDRYSKVFNVFSRYLNKDNRSQLLEFVSGYIKEYPEDRKRVLNIFKESTGYDFLENAAPEIWVISEGSHINLILDQFNGLKSPFYVFNINTCEGEDLLKLKGVSKVDAEKIIAYRDKNKGIKDVSEFEKIEGISSGAVQALKTNSSKETIEKISCKFTEGKLENSLYKIFVASFIHLIYKTIILFVMFFLVYYLLTVRFKIKNRKSLTVFTIKKFLKFLFYVLIGMVSAFFGNGNVIIKGHTLNPIITFVVLIFLCEFITLLFVKKDNFKVKDSLLSTIMMSIIVIFSLY